MGKTSSMSGRTNALLHFSESLQSSPGPSHHQGLEAVTLGVTVKTALPEVTTLPSVIKTVALRFSLVKTNMLLCPRTVLSKLHPCLGY